MRNRRSQGIIGGLVGIQAPEVSSRSLRNGARSPEADCRTIRAHHLHFGVSRNHSLLHNLLCPHVGQEQLSGLWHRRLYVVLSLPSHSITRHTAIVPDPLLHEDAASVDHDLHNSSFDFDLDARLGWVGHLRVYHLFLG